ncbi:MAG: family 16 glycosylhydrolase [Sphingobium sp.]
MAMLKASAMVLAAALPFQPAANARAGAGANGWSEARRGSALDLGGARLVHQEGFDEPLSLNGPLLWAKQHADVGLEKFDPAGGYAYGFADGVLAIRAYELSSGIRSGNVQSVNADQAYQGAAIVPGKRGFTCASCYWEARVRFPQARGTWGSFWLLTPDDPRRRGHLEVDAIEYYGAADRRGHHHTIHRWGPQEREGHRQRGDYTGMDEIADFGWHVYGVDLRGRDMLDGKPALVVYMDGKEVSRIAPDADFLTRPFYFNLTLSINPKDGQRTLPQVMKVDFVRVWK